MLRGELSHAASLGCSDPWRPWRAVATFLSKHRCAAHRSTVAPQSGGRPSAQCGQNLSPIYPGDHRRKQWPSRLHVHPSQSGHWGKSSSIASSKPPRVHGQRVHRIGSGRRFRNRIWPACRVDRPLRRNPDNVANSRRESRFSLPCATVRHQNLRRLPTVSQTWPTRDHRIFGAWHGQATGRISTNGGKLTRPPIASRPAIAPGFLLPAFIDNASQLQAWQWARPGRSY